MSDYSTILEVYTFEELFEMNDRTPEEALEYLVETQYISLPQIKPLNFND